MSAVSSAASTACFASRAAIGGRRAIRCASSSACSSHCLLLDHRVDEPRLARLVGVDPAPGEDQLHRPLLAEHARQPLGAAAAGDDPERDLGLAELGRLGGDDQVAGERELDSRRRAPSPRPRRPAAS